MELFITYQLPSDLLSFAGADDATSSERISAVKGYVRDMQDMIKDSKARELEEKRERDRYDSNMAYESESESNDDNDEYDQRGVMEECEEIMDAREEIVDAVMYQKKGRRSLTSKIGKMLSGKKAFAKRETTDVQVYVPKFKAKKKNSVLESSSSIMSKSVDTGQAAEASPVEVELHIQEETGTTEEPNLTPEDSDNTGQDEDTVNMDYTQIPKILEQAFTQVDTEGAVRPTIINPGITWTKRAQKALLAGPTTSSLGVDEQKSEKNRAFDLLDALSRSGGLSVDHASLHVVVAATHCFDLSLMDTIVKDNVNPIEKVERSTVIMASAIHGQTIEELVQREHWERLDKFSSM